MINAKLYKQIQALLPVVCVDVLIKDGNKGFLLGRRTNPPVENVFWMIGGRLNMDETLEQGAIRKVREETGLKVRPTRAIAIGDTIFEHGEKRRTINVTFIADVIGGKLSYKGHFDKYLHITSVRPSLHPYLRKILIETNAFGKSPKNIPIFRLKERKS